MTYAFKSDGVSVMKKSLLLAFGLALAMASTSAMAAGDASKGKKIFKKCKACHSLKPGKKKIGPSLFGVVGRKSGSAKGFKYSKGMKKLDIVWDEKSLSEFLTAPRKYVKGTRMTFRGLKKEADRKNVIAYLKEVAK